MECLNVQEYEDPPVQIELLEHPLEHEDDEGQLHKSFRLRVKRNDEVLAEARLSDDELDSMALVSHPALAPSVAVLVKQFHEDVLIRVRHEDAVTSLVFVKEGETALSVRLSDHEAQLFLGIMVLPRLVAGRQSLVEQ
jgi:hypothetical protein